MKIIKRTVPTLKQIFKKKAVCCDIKKRPTFYCWFGHNKKQTLQPDFKYRIILKKKFSTSNFGILAIDSIGITLVSISQII